MIDLTPLEVRKKKGDFRRAMRGYEPAMVDDFLDLVADRLDELVRENLALAERVGRQDHQVADYRERERALTEALVTAQEMREEIRKQTTREAELAKQAAEQEAAQLRATTAQETAQLRSKAQQDAAQLRAAAQQEVAELRAALRNEREREEEALRTLRARQQHFLTSYRGFLERELTELGVMVQSFGFGSSSEQHGGAAFDSPARTNPAPAGYDVAPQVGPATGAAPAPGGAGMAFGAAAGLTAAPGGSSSSLAELKLTADRDPGGGQQADEPESGPARPYAAGSVDMDAAFAEDTGHGLRHEGGADATLDDPFGVGGADATLDDPFGVGGAGDLPPVGGRAAAFDVSLPAAGPFEPEPFEAEPFEPEVVQDDVWGEPELEQEAGFDDFDGGPDGFDTAGGGELASADEAWGVDGYEDPIGLPSAGSGGAGGAGGPAAHSPGHEAGAADDLELYDVVAADGAAGVPGPIGLGGTGAGDSDLDDAQDDEDEDTAQLLRNAAAAGYTMTDLDLTDELLLDDALIDEEGAGEDDDPDDDGWLPTLLEDER